MKASFGLGKLYLVPIQQEVPAAEETEETPVVPIVVSEAEKAPTRSRRWIAAAAIVLPLLIAGGWVVKNQVSSGKLDIAGINPFKSTTAHTPYEPRIEEEDIHFDYTETRNTVEFIAKSNPDLSTIYFNFAEDELAPNGIKVKLREAEEKPAELGKVSSLKMWFIVGGAFSEKSNADKMVRSLQAKGYESYIFGQNKGLHLVCYGSYTTKAAAKTALKDVRSKENEKAWLKKN
ncbi:MAG: SPOR domain-containing protein [Flavobacteriales bacterium]|nr:SPOR domain-containing protein [Flavobacteriales bacterium]